MANNRDNAIILVLHAPETESVFTEMKESFGAERALHINKDLYSQAYNLANSYGEAIKIIAYSKTMKHPDLTWLSPEDPGFLECHGKSYAEMLIMGASLAFTTGCKKAVYINHLCPFITREHLDFAFSKITEKNCVFGASAEGRVYMAGLTRENMKVLENFSLWQDNFLEEMLEKAKRNKASVTGMEDLVVVRDEASLKRWLEGKNSSSVFSDILKGAENPFSRENGHRKKRREKHFQETTAQGVQPVQSPEQAQGHQPGEQQPPESQEGK